MSFFQLVAVLCAKRSDLLPSLCYNFADVDSLLTYFIASEFICRTHLENDAYAHLLFVNHVHIGNDVLEFAKSSVVVIFGV